MIGQLKYIELREKASKALGDRFSVKDFHAAVLRIGIVPLDVLEVKSIGTSRRGAGVDSRLRGCRCAEVQNVARVRSRHRDVQEAVFVEVAD